MLYEILILAETGLPSAYHPSPVEWGTSECPPVFNIIQFEGTEEEVSFIRGSCKWKDGNWVHIETGEVFSEDMMIPIFSSEPCKCDEVITPPPHLPGMPEYALRVYYFKKLFPYRNESGIRAVLSAIKSGCWADIREAARNVPGDVVDVVLIPEDKAWLIPDWGLSGSL